MFRFALTNKKFVAFLISMLFVLSGLTSLIYETLWIRALSLGVGSTSASMSMVLAIFFAGLSAGSYWSGKNIDRFRSPLRVYGLIEGAIGIYSFFLIYVLIHFQKILTLLPLSGTFSPLGVFLKFFFVFLFLLIPTVGMGTTLPILVKIFAQQTQHLGRSLSRLYAINTLGAVLGSFVSAFFLIPKLGVLWSNHAAVVVNVLICVAAWKMSRTEAKGGWFVHQATSARRKLDLSWFKFEFKGFSKKLTSSQKIVLLVCGMSGFSSISAEVVWNKYLGIFFGTNIFGLGLILSLFLLGIAAGSFLLSLVIEKVADRKALLIQLMFASVVLTFLTSYLLNLAPTASNVLSYYLGESVSLLLIKSGLTAAILFLPTCVFGAVFPLAISLLSEDAEQAPFVTGVAYSINTIGSILGSYMAGILLIPHLGSANALKFGMMGMTFVAAALVGFEVKSKFGRSFYWTTAAILVVVVMGLPSIGFRNIIKSAYFQASDANLSFSDVMRYFSRDYEEFKLIVEGETAVISLSHDRQDGEGYRNFLRLKTNGLNESIYNTKKLHELPKYEALLGLLPYLYAKDPKNAFIVGYGGGYTVDFFTSTPLPVVHAVELEKGILKAADVVHKGNNPIVKRPNLKLEIEDARYVLASKLHGPYDIVVSQPSHSWLSGVANLFTQEFFEIVSDNLTDRGVFSQWLNLYNMNVEILGSILNTFYSVFPYGMVFTDRDDQEMIMLGSKQPLTLDLARLYAMQKDRKFRDQLAAVPFENVGDVFSNYSMSREEILKAVAGAPINTDVNAYAEVHQSSLFYSKKQMPKTPQTFLSEGYLGSLEKTLPPLAGDQTSGVNQILYQTLVALQRHSKFDKFHVLLKKYESTMPAASASVTANELANLGYLCLQAQRYRSGNEYLKKAFDLEKTTHTLNMLLSGHIELKEYGDVIRIARAHSKHGNRVTECYLLDAFVNSGDLGSARALMGKVGSASREYHQACGIYLDKVIGNYYFASNDFGAAIPFYESYYKSFSSDVKVVAQLSASYVKKNDMENAKSFGAYIATVSGSEGKRLKALADLYRKLGLVPDAEVLEAHAKALGFVESAPASR